MKNLATVTLVESRKSESEVDILQSEGSRIEKISELRGVSRDGRLCYRGSGKVREATGLKIGFELILFRCSMEVGREKQRFYLRSHSERILFSIQSLGEIYNTVDFPEIPYKASELYETPAVLLAVTGVSF